MEKYDLFFQNPREFIKNQRVHSVLYLLRRDIYTCLGYNPTDNSKIEYQALFPGTMAILAGIDLLAKFYKGCEHYNKSNSRFKDFINKYFGCTKEESEIVYQLRNSLLHSFGLYSYKVLNNKKRQEFNFFLNQDDAVFIRQMPDSKYFISINQLLTKFENSIELYKLELKESTELSNNFDKILINYGFLRVK